MEELTVAFSAKDTKIGTLTAQLAQGVEEELGSTKLSRIKEENNRLAMEVKSLT